MIEWWPVGSEQVDAGSSGGNRDRLPESPVGHTHSLQEGYTFTYRSHFFALRACHRRAKSVWAWGRPPSPKENFPPRPEVRYRGRNPLELARAPVGGFAQFKGQVRQLAIRFFLFFTVTVGFLLILVRSNPSIRETKKQSSRARPKWQVGP